MEMSNVDKFMICIIISIFIMLFVDTLFFNKYYLIGNYFKTFKIKFNNIIFVLNRIVLNIMVNKNKENILDHLSLKFNNYL